MSSRPDDPASGSPDAPGVDAPASEPATPAAEPTATPPSVESSGVTSGEVSASEATQLPAQPAADEPILPATFDEASLRDAVGAPKRSRRKPAPEKDAVDRDVAPAGESDAPRRSARTILIVALALIVGLGIAALVLLGRVNNDRYYITCTTTQAIAEQGRAFPPWGARQLTGAEWRPIPLPANAQCKSQQVESVAALEAAFLEILLERTSSTLGARNFVESLPTDGRTPGPLDTVAAQLEQALLLSRAPERGDQRKQVERMLGDVQYWRASLRLRDASAALADAARQFDAAALQRPLHVSDAGAWAELVRRIVDDLRAGPHGVPAGFPPAPAGERPAAPPGTALPVEPEPAPAGSAAPPASPPDAGVPTGGVLL